MREVVDGMTGIPHPEEAAERLSRRMHGADPSTRQFPDSLEGRCLWHNCWGGRPPTASSVPGC